MPIQAPNPPAGVTDLHSQPGVSTDRELRLLCQELETEVSNDVFDRLTQFVHEDETPDEVTEGYRKAALEYVQDCIAYRDEIRPDSLRELANLPDGISRITAGGWVVYRGGNEQVEHDRPESDANTNEHGKYLFFSPDEARVLEDIVMEQFQERPFRSAKLPTIPAKREDWVLCLYQGDNRYWYDLKEQYADPPTVRFRGFKTDAATRRGEYSDRFQESS